MTADLSVEANEDWVTVTIDRPEKANALTGETFVAIGEEVAALDPDDVDGVTLRGSGEHFSAGVDMSGVPEWAEQPPRAVQAQLEAVHDALRAIESADLPVVAALEGNVLGGAVELALACDVRIASRTAAFAFPEADMGLAIDLGGGQKLPRFVGEGLAKYLIMTGEPIDADRALSAGLVESVHDPEEFDTAVESLEETLAAKPTYVHGVAKRQIHAARDGGVEAGMDQAIHHAIACYREPETQRRVTDFLEE